MMMFYAKFRPLVYIVNVYFLSLSLAADLSSYTVPLSNDKWLALKCYILITESSLISGMETLRSPSSNLTLKLITYALGTQNYACPRNSTLPPVPRGANATLIDATPYLNSTIFNTIPKILLSIPSTSLQEHFGPEISNQPFDASLTSTIYFSDSRTFQGRVFDTVRASSNYSVGNDAIDWVALTTTVENATLKEVYCVRTAGGKSPLQCDEKWYEVLFVVPYAAQCWFYG